MAWQVIERILGDLLNTSFEAIQLNPIRQLLEEVPGDKQVVFEKGQDVENENSTYTVKVSWFVWYCSSYTQNTVTLLGQDGCHL